jgi:hypothetical protein
LDLHSLDNDDKAKIKGTLRSNTQPDQSNKSLIRNTYTTKGGSNDKMGDAALGSQASNKNILGAKQGETIKIISSAIPS